MSDLLRGDYERTMPMIFGTAPTFDFFFFKQKTAYEISNHARPGAECRHNLAYWRYQDYVGIGPGAHGRLTSGGSKFATRQHRLPERWLAAVEAAGTGMEERVMIDRETAIEEMLMMGLRLVEGGSRKRLAEIAGPDFESLFHPKLPTPNPRGLFAPR